MSEPDRNEKELPLRLGVREFRGQMTAVLQEVRHGRSFLLVSHDEVLAEINPPSRSVRSPRQPGALRGRIRMTEDFDTLPPDVVGAMESGAV